MEERRSCEDVAPAKLVVLVDKPAFVPRGPVTDGGDVCRALNCKTSVADSLSFVVDPKAFKICEMSSESCKIYVAGGIVCNAIHADRDYYEAGDDGNRLRLNRASTDMDVHIFGGDVEAKKRTIRRMIDRLAPTHMVRSERALTLILSDESRDSVFDGVASSASRHGRECECMRRAAHNVQIMLDSDATIEDALLRCDLDCCRVCTDGRFYYGLPGFARAFRTGVSVVAQPVGANTLERIVKYFCRGYDVVGLDAAQLDLVVHRVRECMGGGNSLVYSNACGSKGGHLEYGYVAPADESFVGKIISHCVADYKGGERFALRFVAWVAGISKTPASEIVDARSNEIAIISYWKLNKLAELCEVVENNTVKPEDAASMLATFASNIDAMTEGIAAMEMQPAFIKR